LAASGATSGCWLWQAGTSTCSCRDGALTTGGGGNLTAGSCN
jgi:hypothetical protein